MPKFKFIAVDKQGKEIKGIEESDSVQAVLAGIRDKGLFPVNVSPLGKGRLFSLLAKGGVSRKIFTISTRQLATLLGAGLPLLKALRVIEEQQPAGHWKNIIKGLIESVESGSSFSDALARYQHIFTRLYINMVKAGESAGLMELVLTRLADYYEKSQKMRGKIISALIYPCLVLGMALLILTGLMIFVVPKFADMFTDMGVELPGMTKFLINTSNNMLTFKFWGSLILIIILIKSAINFIQRFNKGRYLLDKIRLRLPVIGRLVQKLAISRFSRTLGTLVASGVPILGALNIVKETVGNEVVSKGLTIVHDSVKEGESIVNPLRQASIFDPVVINMVAVGEETGKLDEMLIKVADIYENEVDVIIAGITSLLEPVLIITLAIIIGFIVISLFMPLVKLLTALTGG